MKIHIANYEPERTGGGWSFQRNFAKAMKDNISGYAEADVFFVTSASMVERKDVEQAKADGKKIVLRIDNIIRNSRNRNTGMSRMRDMAQMADLVVYQSKFAAKLLRPYLRGQFAASADWGSAKRNEVMIHNAVDHDIFNAVGRDRDTDWTGPIRYLYAKYSSDETKNWEMARSAFQDVETDKKKLTLVGRFDDKLIEYGFDFFMGEEVDYQGMIEDPVAMADTYRHSDVLLYSYFRDACSNTLIEALACGMRVEDCYGMLQTGGAPEIMERYEANGIQYFFLPRLAGEYYEAIAGIL